jgi:Calcineurin-like phosphoesterase
MTKADFALRTTLVGVAVATAVVIACNRPPTGPDPTSTTTSSGPPPPPPSQVFAGAGDIADCRTPGFPAQATARLLDDIDGFIFTAGDNAYPNGAMRDYLNCYEPTWGRHKDRTRPAPGNHEYETPNASAYFDYFGENAGPRGDGYYSFNLGAWHILSLNSNIAAGVGSTQHSWVVRDLQNNRAGCTLAYWHHPLFSSGQNGPSRIMSDIYRALYDANAELVIVGHDHVYERFGPQTVDGNPDDLRGIRQFTVGVGGAELTPFRTPARNSEVRLSAYGILKLSLNATSYDAAFIQTNGSIGDVISGRCH